MAFLQKPADKGVGGCEVTTLPRQRERESMDPPAGRQIPNKTKLSHSICPGLSWTAHPAYLTGWMCNCVCGRDQCKLLGGCYCAGCQSVTRSHRQLLSKPIHLSINLSIYQSIYPSIHLSLSPAVCASLYNPFSTLV